MSMDTFIAFLKSHWSMIVAIVIAIWGVVGSSVQMEVAMHPTLAIILSNLTVILAYLSPSPVAFWKK